MVSFFNARPASRGRSLRQIVERACASSTVQAGTDGRNLDFRWAPEWQEQLDKLNGVRAVYGTTALEGNPLPEAAVSHQIDLLEGKNGTQSVATNREQQQIRNSALAQSWMRERFCPASAPMTVPDILEMHRMVTQHSDTTNNIPAHFRTFSVQVGSPDMGGVQIK